MRGAIILTDIGTLKDGTRTPCLIIVKTLTENGERGGIIEYDLEQQSAANALGQIKDEHGRTVLEGWMPQGEQRHIGALEDTVFSRYTLSPEQSSVLRYHNVRTGKGKAAHLLEQRAQHEGGIISLRFVPWLYIQMHNLLPQMVDEERHHSLICRALG